jgi:hypothetical protein
MSCSYCHYENIQIQACTWQLGGWEEFEHQPRAVFVLLS